MSPAAVEDGKERRSGERCRRAAVEEIVVGSSRLKSRYPGKEAATVSTEERE